MVCARPAAGLPAKAAPVPARLPARIALIYTPVHLLPRLTTAAYSVLICFMTTLLLLGIDTFASQLRRCFFVSFEVYQQPLCHEQHQAGGPQKWRRPCNYEGCRGFWPALGPGGPARRGGGGGGE